MTFPGKVVGGHARLWAAAATAIAIALVLAACGGGSSSSGTDATTAPSPSASGKTEEADATVAPDSSASGKAKKENATKSPSASTKAGKKTAPAEGTEPSAEFAGKGENGELATAGKESTDAEREAASKVLEESLVAAANGEWAKQCATLSRGFVEAIEKRSKAKKQSCAENLKLTGEALGGTPLNPMTEPLAALRVNGNLAFAFFHGSNGTKQKDFVIPMARENGQWKVSALGPQETP